MCDRKDQRYRNATCVRVVGQYRYDIVVNSLQLQFPFLSHNSISIMNTIVVACTSSPWLQVYNVRATQFVASLLGLSVNQSQERRSVTLCAPSGAIIRTVSITPTTEVADICLDSEQFFLDGDYETVLEQTSLVWKHKSNGQLTVMASKFEGIEDRVLNRYTHRVSSLNWHPDGTKLASGLNDDTFRIWDMTSNSSECIAICRGHLDCVETMQWSPSGTQLASGSWDTTIRIWDTTSWECLYILRGHTDFVLSISWHQSGNWIASGGDDNTIRIWELTSTGTKCLHVFSGHIDSVWAVHWNPSGTQLASGSSDKTIRIWDIDLLTGKCVHVLTGHTSGVSDVQWNPTGTLLASASCDDTIRIWETGTWRWLHVLADHTSSVYSLSWNSTGTLLASGSDDERLRVGHCYMEMSSCTSRPYRFNLFSRVESTWDFPCKCIYQ